MKEKMSKPLFDQAWSLRVRIKNCITAECECIDGYEQSTRMARLYRTYNRAYERFLRRQETLYR
jgi:hypothetical protein